MQYFGMADDWRYGVLDETERIEMLNVREAKLGRRMHEVRLGAAADQHQAAIRTRIAQLGARARVYGRVLVSCIESPMDSLRIDAEPTAIELISNSDLSATRFLDRPGLAAAEVEQHPDGWVTRATRQGLALLGESRTLEIQDAVDPSATADERDRHLDALEARLEILEAAAGKGSGARPAALSDEELIDQLFAKAEALAIEIAVSPLPEENDSLGLSACYCELEARDNRRQVVELVRAIESLPGAVGFDRLRARINLNDVELSGVLLSYQY